MADELSSELFDNLQLLLKAPSKDFVKDMCVRSHRGPSVGLVQSAAAALDVSEAQAAQLARSLRALSAHVVFRKSSSAEGVGRLFPEAFHCGLKNLLTKILLDNREAWKTDAVAAQASLPRLKAADWRVDLVSSSDALSRMCVPTCLLRFQVGSQASGRARALVYGMRACDRQTEEAGREDSARVAAVELSRESLDTMLDGLGRIRDQLSAVAGK